jgi:hypothetical protein
MTALAPRCRTSPESDMLASIGSAELPTTGVTLMSVG